MPNIMISQLTKDVVSWLNQLPSKGCIIDKVGSCTLMTEVQFGYNIHCHVEFGKNCQVHEDKQAKNRVDLECTTDAIAMRNSGNLLGGYHFMNLNKQKIVIQHHFTIVHITNKVIQKVND